MPNTVDTLASKLEESYDPEMFLGRLGWYSVPDTLHITQADFTNRLKAAGVKFGANLPVIRPVDVFKRACTNATVKKYVPTLDEVVAATPTKTKIVTTTDDIGTAEDMLERLAMSLDDDDLLAALGGEMPDAKEMTEVVETKDIKPVYFNYLMRSAGSEDTKVYRLLIREVVDFNGHELWHGTIAHCTFDRAANVLTIAPAKDDNGAPIATLDVEDRILDGIKQYYTSQAGIITPYAVREFIRKNIEWHLHALKVRASGGVYFVQEQYASTLLALEKVINDIGGNFHTLPLLDDNKQRQMLKAAFESESIEDADALMAEMMAILGDTSKTITSRRWVEFSARYDKMRQKVLEYSDVLDETLERTASYLELTGAQILELADRVED